MFYLFVKIKNTILFKTLLHLPYFVFKVVFLKSNLKDNATIIQSNFGSIFPNNQILFPCFSLMQR